MIQSCLAKCRLSMSSQVLTTEVTGLTGHLNTINGKQSSWVGPKESPLLL